MPSLPSVNSYADQNRSAISLRSESGALSGTTESFRSVKVCGQFLLPFLGLRDGQGRACALSISSRLDAGQKAQREKGAYLLRTNCEETAPVLLWK